MFEELGISFGTALIVLLALYFIIKWAVKNGIKEAYRDITGKVTTEDIEAEQARVSVVPEIVGRARAWRTSVREPSASPRGRASREAATSSSSDGRQAAGT